MNEALRATGPTAADSERPPDDLSPRRVAATILSRLESFGVKLGLDSTHRILHRLGDPQKGLPTVLVAGTNGKGSTAAMLAAVLGAAGYRVGLFTSPHVEEVEERIRIDGVAIDRIDLGRQLDRVVRTAEKAVGHPPTYFEALTEVAYAWFAEQRVDLAVMETGLGGRLDATNAGDPVLSIITEIGLDHTSHLGHTLPGIAREKAGILRAGRPALAWVTDRQARRSLVQVASRLGARLDVVADRRRVVAVAGPAGWQGQRLRVSWGDGEFHVELPLAGRHQGRNLELVVRATESLATAGWGRLDGAALRRGIAGCRWPGRLERVALPGGRTVLLDCAHNPQAVGSLLDFLSEVDVEFDLLFGVLAEKQVESMLPPLAQRAGRVVLTAPDSPRAVSPEILAGHLAAATAVVEADAVAALEHALRSPGPLLVVCGSIYLVGEVRRELTARYGVPRPAVESIVRPQSRSG